MRFSYLKNSLCRVSRLSRWLRPGASAEGIPSSCSLHMTGAASGARNVKEKAMPSDRQPQEDDELDVDDAIDVEVSVDIIAGCTNIWTWLLPVKILAGKYANLLALLNKKELLDCCWVAWRSAYWRHWSGFDIAAATRLWSLQQSSSRPTPLAHAQIQTPQSRSWLASLRLLVVRLPNSVYVFIYIICFIYHSSKKNEMICLCGTLIPCTLLFINILIKCWYNYILFLWYIFRGDLADTSAKT